MISFISPRRYGKTTFALKRYHQLKLKDHRWRYLTPTHAQAEQIKALYKENYPLKENEYPARLEKALKGIIDLDYFLSHRESIVESGCKWVIDDIEFILPALIGKKTTTIDTITGTLNRVPLVCPDWLKSKEEELKNMMSQEAFDLEYLGKFND